MVLKFYKVKSDFDGKKCGNRTLVSGELLTDIELRTIRVPYNYCERIYLSSQKAYHDKDGRRFEKDN